MDYLLDQNIIRNQLIPSLMEPSIRIIGNTRYPNSRVVYTKPVRPMKKVEIFVWIVQLGVQHDPYMTLIEARKTVLKTRFSNNAKLEVKRLQEV